MLNSEFQASVHHSSIFYLNHFHLGREMFLPYFIYFSSSCCTQQQNTQAQLLIQSTAEKKRHEFNLAGTLCGFYRWKYYTVWAQKAWTERQFPIVLEFKRPIHFDWMTVFFSLLSSFLLCMRHLNNSECTMYIIVMCYHSIHAKRRNDEKNYLGK